MTGPSGHDLVISLGSNVGDRMANLRGGLDSLLRAGSIVAVAVSPVYRTEPVGGPAQPYYYNAVLVARTSLGPRAVLAACRQAEDEFGRARQARWGPRTLDLDVIVYGDEVSEEPDLTLPHPRAHERAFVLAPWYAADPHARIPGRGRVADLLARTGLAGVHRLDNTDLRPHT